MKSKVLLPLFFVAIFLINGKSQDLREIEREICRNYNYGIEEGFPATKLLLQYTSTVPSTLTYNFDSLRLYSRLPKGGIYTSDDSSFRIYCIKEDNIIQYSNGITVKSLVLKPLNPKSGPNFHFRELYTIKSDNKTGYFGIYETTEGEGIKFFSVSKSGLNDSIKLIKTSSGIHNELTYTAYDFKDNPNRFIYYDATTMTIYFPLVNSNFLFTNKTIGYRFTGQYFEKVGE